MSNLSTFYKPAITRNDLGLGTANNVTFASIQNTPIGSTTSNSGTFTTLNATGTTELVNGGTTAGPFRVYNQSTTATNYERGKFAWESNILRIGTEKGSVGGTARALEFQTDGVTRMTIGSAGAVTMSNNNTMVFRTSATKFTTLSTNATGGGLILTLTSDISNISSEYGIFVAGGPLRITGANGYGQSLVTSGNIATNSIFAGAIGAVNSGSVGWVFSWNGSVGSVSTGAGVTVVNLSAPLVRIGGTTASFPALRNSSTTLQVRLADDTAFAPLECAGLTLNGNLTASTRNIVTDTTTGTKIGTATTQKIGFFDKTPVVQQAAVADATDAATVITQLNALLARIRTLGLIAT